MTNKIPAFQFYPADWRKDPGVQSLSYFDRGVWFEILCLMHESEQRGRLLLNGKPMPDEALARLLGLDKQVLLKTLATLLEYGVGRRDENGALYSKRMVEDENERSRNAERQRRFYNKANGKPNANLTDDQTEILHTSSSSSSSSILNLSNGGGSRANGKPATAANSPPRQPEETQQAYLSRKQLEFPHLDVSKIFADFSEKCGSANYPKLKRTRPNFDRWLETEYPPMIAIGGDAGGGNGGYVNPETGRGLK